MSESVSIEERAARYISKIQAVSGSDGHGETYKAACALAIGFNLDEGQVTRLLADWNVSNASPAWSEKELAHKVRQAMKAKSNASSEEIGSKVGNASRTSRTGVSKSQKSTGESRTFRTFPIRSKNSKNTISRTLRTTSFIPTRVCERACARDKGGVTLTPSETSEGISKAESGSLGEVADERSYETVIPDEVEVWDAPPVGLVREVDGLMEAFKSSHGGQGPTVVTLPSDVLPERETFMGMQVERSEQGVSVR